jgi:two-component system, sensor histidine kinase and response regulator
MEARACVLIVDDEERNRTLLRTMLRNEYRTLEAENGPAALEVVQREHVDLVLLDVMMPGMTGYDVCKQIKETCREPYLPVLLITALSDQEQKNIGLQSGADDFLAKPVDRRELHLRVRAFLKLRAQDMLIRVQLSRLAALQTAKDEMLSLMVHDLRSPLSGIMAHLSMLIEELPEGELREDARAALRGANTMLKSLEEALQIRLLEEGQLPVTRTTVDLAGLLNDAVATLSAVARRKNIDLSTTFEGKTAASLDGKLVRRAIENLLANALKYTPGGKDVSVAVRHLPGAVEVDVADRGPGIPADLKASMFDKFGSVEAKKGGTRKGFGLGLYLVKLVAEGHAGGAEVLDRDGGGAVFRVRLRTEAA